MLPLAACLRRRPAVITPAAFGTKLGSNVAYLSRRGFLRTHGCPWSGSRSPDQGFLFTVPRPAACPRFDQYAPKTSRKGSALCHTFVIVIVGRIGEAVSPANRRGWRSTIAVITHSHFLGRRFCVITLNFGARFLRLQPGCRGLSGRGLRP